MSGYVDEDEAQKIIAELKRRAESAERALAELQKDECLCFWCGATFPYPKKGTNEEKAAALTAHTMDCREHPMHKLIEAERALAEARQGWIPNEHAEHQSIDSIAKLVHEDAALRTRLEEVEKERQQDAKADAEIQETVGKYMADVERLQSRVTVLEEALRIALRQWEGYVSDNRNEDLGAERHAEARMYRDCRSVLAPAAPKEQP